MVRRKKGPISGYHILPWILHLVLYADGKDLLEHCIMWGIATAILGTALGLSLLEGYMKQVREAPGKQEKLPESDKDSKPRADGQYTAPLWRDTDAQKQALKRAQQLGRKLK